MREEIRKLFPLEFYINNKGEMVSEISLKTLNKLSDEIIKLEEENEELNGIFGTWNSRKLIKKFNKEYDKEDKNKNPNRDYVAIYPDAEEVYKRYYDYKSRNEKAIDKLYCYGEVFDGKILQQFQKEMLNILQGSDK